MSIIEKAVERLDRLKQAASEPAEQGQPSAAPDRPAPAAEPVVTAKAAPAKAAPVVPAAAAPVAG
ncbi:MAG TPA: chromosome partitioning ATPase, partial [Thauera sp.]|nr:chromosome partitioning ATPase [Thauera sp.]